MDGWPAEPIESPGWDDQASAAAELDLKEQNRAADGDVMEWPTFTVRWKTRRGWLTPSGWAVATIPTFFLLLPLGSWLAYGSGSHGLQNVAIGAAATGAAAALVAFVPQLRQHETASWSLTVSSTYLRLDKEVPGLQRLSTLIRRVDAGKLEIRTSKWMRRGAPGLVWAAGSSIDGTAIIALSEMASATGPLGLLLPGVPLARVLVSWWPANGRSVSALLDFEALDEPYWHPNGVPSRPRSNLGRDF